MRSSGGFDTAKSPGRGREKDQLAFGELFGKILNHV
jgi:hypothetical protein